MSDTAQVPQTSDLKSAIACERVRVWLAEGFLAAWVDPETHLVVTREPREVPLSLIGEAARREPAVIIEPLTAEPAQPAEES